MRSPSRSRRSLALQTAVLSALVLVACTTDDFNPAGMWVWHEPWQSAPPEIVRDTGPRSHASALVLRFCENGTFRITSGVLYRAGRDVNLGASDGLTMYRGTWSSSGRQIRIRYRLVDAEIRFRGYEQALQTDISTNALFDGRNVRFTFHRPVDARAFPLAFEPARALGAEMSDDFLECTPQQRSPR